ncbi:MAG: hypothetical protein J6Y37_18265 [Paludibacteraceae bacterium]|nr:hypothetical protein [Paludibacteraceae bacterium]
MMEFVTWGDMVKYANDNGINDDTLLFVDFGQGDGSYVRHVATMNYKGSVPFSYDKNSSTLEIRLSPNCLGWVKVNTLHPIVLSNT